MSISQSTVQFDLLEVIRIPLRRPDNGGRHANYGSAAKISKGDGRLIKDKLCSKFPETFPLLKTVYDGEKFMFSSVKLTIGEFKVENIREGGPKYNFKINSVENLGLSQLDGYLKARELDDDDDLGCGLIASRGFQHSRKPTTQGLVVCVDYSVLSSQKPVSVLDYLEKILQVNFDKIDPLNSTDREKVEKALRDLEVNVIHRQTDQKYKIAGVTLYPSNDLKFKIKKKNQSKEVMLIDYYLETYKEIEYRNLPCLDVSRNSNNYIPIEFCVLAERQRNPKEDLQHSVRKMKNIAMPDPLERMELICKAAEAKNGPHGYVKL
ncbi:hypothetical protein GIB67_001984 [Kingdonia uniflora]|uniref:PAZ domain-containing protein n=1 Tax=Kingdonia uniflora TaxID=39325 RepID=A0A7J7M9X5_9MAGN|nr:hypothetical protein GIB67_001984 [Kingdonia uniflora]